MGPGAFLFGHAARLRQTVNGGKGDLVLLRVLAGGLPKRLGRLFNIENVVDYLERQSDVFAVTGKRGIPGRVGDGVNRAQPETRAEQGASLGAMNSFEQLRVRR